MRRVFVVVVTLIIGVVAAAVAVAASPGGDVRLTNDVPSAGGYTSDYTLVTGRPYSDATLSECSQSRGRQNEPADGDRSAQHRRDSRFIQRLLRRL